MTAPTYRQCSQYFHQYIDHLAVAYNDLMQPFFASGTFFPKGSLLDRYCLHTRVAILRGGESTVDAFDYLFWRKVVQLPLSGPKLFIFPYAYSSPFIYKVFNN